MRNLFAGKSLDTIMELKERAGDQDLFDVLKKKRKKQKKLEQKVANAEKKVKPPNVFEFLNKKIHADKHKGNLKDVNTGTIGGKPASQPVKHISLKDLKQKSDKNINIQVGNRIITLLYQLYWKIPLIIFVDKPT